MASVLLSQSSFRSTYRKKSTESVRHQQKRRSQIDEWCKWEEQYSEPAELYEWLWAMRERSALDWTQGLSQQECREIVKRQFHLPVQVIESHVLLGDSLCVHNIESLKRLGVTRVLNAAGGSAVVPIDKLAANGIAYSAFDQAQDIPSYPMLKYHFDEARAIFATEHALQGKVLVHCVQGLNRSAILVAAEYMLLHGIDILSTVKYVRKQRGSECLTNRGFHLQLAELAQRHNLLGPKPGGAHSCVSNKAPPYWSQTQSKSTQSSRPSTPTFFASLLRLRSTPNSSSRKISSSAALTKQFSRPVSKRTSMQHTSEPSTDTTPAASPSTPLTSSDPKTKHSLIRRRGSY